MAGRRKFKEVQDRYRLRGGRNQAADFELTDQGRAVLAVLLR
jgi:hypothetical protein